MAAAYVIGFLEGTGWHAYCLATGGLHAYGYAPLLIQLFYLQPVGLLPITLFGLFVLLTASPLRRTLRSGDDDPRDASRATTNVTDGTSA
ncbi:hypothetical protein ACQ4WX_46085 [Streptomyces lasalocidi]